MAKTVVIYHGNCADGFTAAWVVKKWWNEGEGMDHEIEFIAGVYQRPVPLEKIAGCHVIIVDFSYKFAEMEQIAAAAATLTWIDHHKSAILDMQFWLQGSQPNNTTCFTDLERSGAGLAWDYYFPNTVRPMLVNYVEDRDLWKFRYPETRAVQAYIFSYEYTFEIWDKLADLADYDTATMIAGGESIERKHFKDINELLPICTRHIRIANHIIPCANLPYTMVSDAGNILAQRNPLLFGICYYDGMDGRNFSLRSVEGGMDVSEIAKKFGGGGHAKAAGFRVSFEQAKQFEVDPVKFAQEIEAVERGG